MTKNEYLKYALKHNLPLKLKWVRDMFGILVDEDIEDEFIEKKDSVLYVKLDNDEKEILMDKYVGPVFKVTDKIKVNNEYLPNINGEIETTVGRLIMNYLLLAKPFGNKIPYINRKFSISEIEDIIKNKLTDNENPKPDEITITEYQEFVDLCVFVMNYGKIVSVSATKKAVLPPPHVVEYRNKLIEEAIKKYGPNALDDKTVIAEIMKKLLEYDDSWLKGDPAYDTLLTGKVKNVARLKMFLMFGLGSELTPKPKPTVIMESLYEGYPKDPKKLAAMFNDSRYASYSRGFKTQEGGVVAKVTLRATNDIKIVDSDCGTKVGIEVKFTKDNYKKYVNRYMLDNGKTVLITSDIAKSLIGKKVIVRSPATCKYDYHFCRYCMSESLKDYENGIALMMSGVAGTILNESMKAMHKSGTVETVELEIEKELI